MPMNKTTLALCIGFAVVQSSRALAAAPDAADGDGDSRNAKQKSTPNDTTLGTVSVTGKLDQARNQLSPDVGSSEYIFDRKSIDQLPLGAATSLNQLLLRAP